MVKTEDLNFVDAFRELDGRQLAEVRERLVTGRYRGGQPIFHEGDPGLAMYFILEGSVQICRRTQQGTRQLIERIRSGQVFGEMAIVDGGPRSATALAVGETKLAVLGRKDFEALMETQPRVAALLLRRISRMLSLRLRRTNAML